VRPITVTSVPSLPTSLPAVSQADTTRHEPKQREGEAQYKQNPFVGYPLMRELRRGAVMESFELGIQTTGFTSSKPKLHAKFANGWGGKHSIDAAIFSSS